MEKRKNNLFVSEILSRAFNICTDNFLEILKAIGIFIVPALILPFILAFSIFPIAIIGSGNMYSYSYPDAVFERMLGGIGAGIILLTIIISLIIALLSLFGSLVIIKIVDDANRGNEVSWRLATSYVWERKWRALGLNVLVFIMLIIGLIALSILFIILVMITLGIGIILLFPLFFIIVLILTPTMVLFNSTFLINDLNVTDSIRETFLLFRKGYFWATIGRIITISSIFFGVSLLLIIFNFIPFIGSILTAVVSCVMSVYMSAYISVFVYDRNKPNIDSFGGNENSDNGFIDPII